jgi:hypothetical protein
MKRTSVSSASRERDATLATWSRPWMSERDPDAVQSGNRAETRCDSRRLVRRPWHLAAPQPSHRIAEKPIVLARGVRRPIVPAGATRCATTEDVCINLVFIRSGHLFGANLSVRKLRNSSSVVRERLE